MEENFDEILNQKEKELKDIQKLKIKSLDKKLQEREEQFIQLQSKYQEQERDFNFNLQVIEQRDQDINELTEKLIQLKEICDNKQYETQSLQEELQRQNFQFRQQIEQSHDSQKSLLEKIEDLKKENKFYKNSFSDEIKKYKDQNESLQKELKFQTEQFDVIKEKYAQEFDKALVKNLDKVNIEKLSLEKQIEKYKQEREQYDQNNFKNQERLVNENNRLQAEINQLKFDKMDKDQSQQDVLIETKAKQRELALSKELAVKELETYKQNYSNFENLIKEKVQTVQLEKERIQNEYLSYKQKQKSKNKEIKEQTQTKLNEIIVANRESERKLEQELKDLQIENERVVLQERVAKEKLQDLDQKFKRELNNYEIKFQQHIKNFDQDKRQIKNELEIKEFQQKQLQNDKYSLERQITDDQNQFRDFEKKIAEITVENKMLLEELVKFRRGRKADRNQDKEEDLRDQRDREKFKESEVNLKDRKSPKKQKQISTEKNRQLDEEDDSYEKYFSDDLGPASPLNTIHHEKNDSRPFYNESMKTGKNSSQFTKTGVRAQGIKRIKDLEQENSTYKQLIDGMTKEMENARNKMIVDKQEVNFLKEENLHLRSRINELQQDILNYKERLMNTNENRQNQSKYFDQNQNQEEFNNLKQIVNNKEKEIQNLLQKCDKFQNETKRVKKERDQLIEISNDLQQQLQNYKVQFGDKDEYQEDAEFTIIEKQQNQEKENQIANLAQEIQKLKVANEKRDNDNSEQDKKIKLEEINKVISIQKETQQGTNAENSARRIQSREKSEVSFNQRQSSQEQITNQGKGVQKGRSKGSNEFKKPNLINVPKYSNFMDVEDSIPSKLQSDNLKIISQQKQIIPRVLNADNLEQKDPLDNSPQYQPNSKKATNSQRQIEVKLGQIKEKNSQKSHSRNYNLKDQEDEEI